MTKMDDVPRGSKVPNYQFEHGPKRSVRAAIQYLEKKVRRKHASRSLLRAVLDYFRNLL